MLVKHISEEEVKFAMWSCDSSKSPGPDGFNFGFLKFYWEILKKDILKAVKEFADRGSWLRGSNASFSVWFPRLTTRSSCVTSDLFLWLVAYTKLSQRFCH